MSNVSNGIKRTASWSPVAIFYKTDFPNMATHEPQETCGYSLYKGVLVQWDEDHDTRTLMLLDAMSVPVREQLLIVQEHEGQVAFVWNYDVPEGYEQGQSVEVAMDSWYISSSYAVRPWNNEVSGSQVENDELGEFGLLDDNTSI